MENKNELPHLCECGDCGGKAEHRIERITEHLHSNGYWHLTVACTDCGKQSSGTKSISIKIEHYLSEYMEWNANQEHIILSKTAGAALPGRRASI